MNANEVTRRTAESAAMLIIGDGVLGVLRPAEHCLIWSAGPQWWREIVGWFAAHPKVTRGAAVVEVGAGLWLAMQSQQDIQVERPDEARSLPA
ncbi:MAG TPA: hypothetical protein VGF24_06570 [Vicinamibacterales bacterium]|jgi:hypothetical protein